MMLKLIFLYYSSIHDKGLKPMLHLLMMMMMMMMMMSILPTSVSLSVALFIHLSQRFLFFRFFTPVFFCVSAECTALYYIRILYVIINILFYLYLDLAISVYQ